MVMFKTIRNYFFPGEIERIIKAAHQFPRYTGKEIRFRGLTLRMTDYLSVAYQLQEIFGEERLKFRSTSARPLIYDCGANIGIVSLYFKSIFPGARIRAFEPDPEIFSCLKSNIEKSRYSEVLLDPRAVWIHDQGIEFASEGADGGSIYFPGKKKRVESVRLASLLESEKEIDLLKIDIEGAETEVIRDCRHQLHKVKHLFIEYHSWRNRKQELDELLAILREENFRYRVQSLGQQVHQPFLHHDTKDGMDIQLDIYAIHVDHKK